MPNRFIFKLHVQRICSFRAIKNSFRETLTRSDNADIYENTDTFGHIFEPADMADPLDTF